ncbi:FliM/FliN family flagellar motor switch protein, partial [Vibrio parahaemolyticus]
QIQTAEVELIVNFGTARVNFTDLLHMQVGDVIPLQTNTTVEAQVDGVPVMECSYGQSNGQYALRVEKLLSITHQETP